MSNNIFIDTSGFYAVLVGKDEKHDQAKEVFREVAEAAGVFVTTDYILDETVTLLRARGFGHLLPGFMHRTLNSRACRVEWMDSQRFRQTWDLQQKCADQGWSFTDCFSFWIMDGLEIRKALTKDQHFEHCGYHALLV